jgi:hypothetical protein
VRPTRVGIDETVMTTGRPTKRRQQLLRLDTSRLVAVTHGRNRTLHPSFIA